MLFNSYIFILFFMPIVIIGWYSLNHKGLYFLANYFMIAASITFYGYYNPKYLFVLIGSVTFNFTVSKAMFRFDKDKRIFLWFGIVANTAIIFYFKYFDFFLSNINAFVGTDFNLRHLILPLGISFFTFQQISFLVDSYKGETKDYSFTEYILFVSFFPQLIAGPIVMHNELIPQFRDLERRSLNYSSFAAGLYIFNIGLFKKVMIADTFSKAVVWGYGNAANLSSMEAIIVSFAYTFQLYFDFSGYCDMALGLGKILNIELPQNFNSPYQATSIPDFWKRWHMSLTRFLRQYIYFPLGGSRKGKIRTYFNIMAVFLISGIWHGANWTFILWGSLHGLLNCLNRGFSKYWEKLHFVFRWGVTFCLVNILWIFFRAASVNQAILIIKKMFSMKSFSVSSELVNCFNLPELSLNIFSVFTGKIYGFWMWVFFGVALFIVLNLKNCYEIKFKPTPVKGITTVILAIWSIMSLTGVSEFLYFGF